MFNTRCVIAFVFIFVFETVVSNAEQCQMAQVCVADVTNDECMPGQVFVPNTSIYNCCPGCAVPPDTGKSCQHIN